jgi:transcriptional regulator with XRE-family HTH domain
MKPINNSRKILLNQSAYWVEGLNGYLYDAIMCYMEKNNMNRTSLANYLGISKGRVSQILNDGNINFSIEKVIEIALKVDKFPIFEFSDKDAFYEMENKLSEVKRISIPYNYNDLADFEKNSDNNNESKIISIDQNHTNNIYSNVG